jgi:hypothetical protein
MAANHSSPAWTAKDDARILAFLARDPSPSRIPVSEFPGRTPKAVLARGSLARNEGLPGHTAVGIASPAAERASAAAKDGRLVLGGDEARRNAAAGSDALLRAYVRYAQRHLPGSPLAQLRVGA